MLKIYNMTLKIKHVFKLFLIIFASLIFEKINKDMQIYKKLISQLSRNFNITGYFYTFK